MMDFSDYLHNVYSQCGEDGVLEQMFEMIGIKEGTLVEFGAWDGFTYSNAQYPFQKNKNLHIVFIEPDIDKFEILCQKNDHPNIHCINDFVRFDKGSLNRLLDGHIYGPLQLLSMDTDNDDFEIWKNTDKSLNPTIIVMEYSVWDSKNARKQMCNQLKKDGYSLAFLTGNWIFVRNDVFNKLDIPEQDPEVLFHKCKHIDICLSLGKITKDFYDSFARVHCQGPNSEGFVCRTWLMDEEYQTGLST